MEWVEATGKSIEEAVQKVQEILGVRPEEIEVQVLEEPKAGLFGRMKTEAQIKARVRPRSQHNRPRKTVSEKSSRTTKKTKSNGTNVSKRNEDPKKSLGKTEDSSKQKKPLKQKSEEKLSMEQINNEQQLGEDFLRGLVSVLGIQGTVNSEIADDDIQLSIDGENLGFLVGRKGVTLSALQELTRQVVKNKVSERPARINIDIANYRMKREEALRKFAIEVAQEVAKNKVSKAMEPMGAVDRRIVHNAVTEIEGVETASAGTDPRRYVIIKPASNN